MTKGHVWVQDCISKWLMIALSLKLDLYRMLNVTECWKRNVKKKKKMSRKITQKWERKEREYIIVVGEENRKEIERKKKSKKGRVVESASRRLIISSCRRLLALLIIVSGRNRQTETETTHDMQRQDGRTGASQLGVGPQLRGTTLVNFRERDNDVRVRDGPACRRHCKHWSWKASDRRPSW